MFSYPPVFSFLSVLKCFIVCFLHFKNTVHHMFDHTHYNKMKLKYDKTNGFPEIFDKVCKAGQKGKPATNSKKKQ